jgi:hypothetical protein
MGFGNGIAIPLAYGCAFGGPFQGRLTGGGEIAINCSKIATRHRRAPKRSIFRWTENEAPEGRTAFLPAENGFDNPARRTIPGCQSVVF